ncbi:MAG: hypothetical protein ACFFCW_00985 [Candidatus Hodarchaeota archaeon]
MRKTEGLETRQSYAEVWNDTVDIRHLGWSSLICVSACLTAYILACKLLEVLKPTLDGSLRKGYSLGIAVVACLMVSVVCALIFKAKRHVEEAPAFDDDILDALQEEGISLQDESVYVERLPENVKSEMKSLGLYDKLKGASKDSRTAPE